MLQNKQGSSYIRLFLIFSNAQSETKTVSQGGYIF
jgi:hypothetical protein